MNARKQPVAGDVFAGKFRFDRQIGSGGMGLVWQAWNLQLEIPVAIKVMAGNVAEQPGILERFEREARAAAQIRGAHVVNIYEHGVHEGLPYMVMELLEGEDLNQRLKRDKRLSLPVTAAIVRDLCKALHRAHELGIIHRDLKPANIFLVRDGDEAIAKVLDFGVAKLTRGGDGGVITATDEIMGTPSYMSPEHIQASKYVDPRADLWSLGVIAFRALTGHMPYSGQIFDVTSQILSGPMPVPSAFAPDLPPAVDAFFARALARDIDRRFQTARELSEAFGKLLEAAPRTAEASSTAAPLDADELPTVAAPRPEASRSPSLPLAAPAAPSAPAAPVAPVVRARARSRRATVVLALVVVAAALFAAYGLLAQRTPW